MKNKILEQFINNEFVVNCKTENEANEFIKLCYENNLKWERQFSDVDTTNWYIYQDKTCYNAEVKYQHLLYSELAFYKQQNETIITYQEFINKLKGENKKMKTIKVEDLKCNELEVLENGTLRIIEKGKFIPKEGEKYYYIDRFWFMRSSTYEKHINDIRFIKHNLVFRTEQECQKYRNYLNALDKYSYEFSDEEWEDDCIEKYDIGYDVIDKYIRKDISRWVKRERIYFKSEDDLTSFINEAGEDNIKKFMFNVWE